MPHALSCSALLLVTLAACAGSAPAPSTAEVTIAPAAPAPPAAASAAPDEGESKAAALARELDHLDMSTLAALSGSDASDQGGVQTGALSGLPSSGGTTAVAGLRLGGGNAVGPGAQGGLTGVGAAPGSPGVPTVRGPVSNVNIGGASLSGGAVANAQAVVAGMAAGFRRCINKSLASDPSSITTGAKVRLTATIDASGAVLSATSSAAAGFAAPAIACMKARIQAAQFAPSVGGTATLVIPVTAQIVP